MLRCPVNIVLYAARASRAPCHRLPSRPKEPANSTQPVSFLQLAHSSHRSPRSFPLFSIASTLLPKNTRVGGTQLLTGCRLALQNSPFVFMRLRIAFPATSLLSRRSALPPVILPISFSRAPVCVPPDSLASTSTLPPPTAQSLHLDTPREGPLQSTVCAPSPLPHFSKPAAQRLLLSFSQPFARLAGPCRTNGVNYFSFRNDHGSALKKSSEN
jgi:hypothetical protein